MRFCDRGWAEYRHDSYAGMGLNMSFAADIRPLFHQSDIEAMAFLFDLSDYEAVKANAESIHERLADGTMPCDAAWPAERVASFRRWVEEGCNP